MFPKTALVGADFRNISTRLGARLIRYVVSGLNGRFVPGPQ